MATQSYVGTVKAPPFPSDLDWLNTNDALHIDDPGGQHLGIEWVRMIDLLGISGRALQDYGCHYPYA